MKSETVLESHDCNLPRSLSSVRMVTEKTMLAIIVNETH